ncbi:DUF2690 domain-containing protein [Streptomyces sp. URMC 126]|uniref:helix-turn-helix domain-containing protein n=1 Tax=Streptomyces sp. URMC 126 TaxID=3423401 RepID=UPI003F1B0D5D
MPRWRALSDELDPQVREFVEQLRRIVERNGMSVGAVADRTGYSKTSWERYLNGRLLPPRGATEALAESTGTDVEHLLTIWELAERAWSRSELRHDVTMEGLRVEAARAALAEYAPPPAPGRRGWTLRRARAAGPDAVGGGSADGVTGGADGARGAAEAAESAGVMETPKARQERSDADDGRGGRGGRDFGGARDGSGEQGAGGRRVARPSPDLPSARAAGVDARAQAIPLTGSSASTDLSAGPSAGASAPPPEDLSMTLDPAEAPSKRHPRPSRGNDSRSGHDPRLRTASRTHPHPRPRPKRRAALLFTVGAVGALLMVVAAVLLLGYGPGGSGRKPVPSAAARDSGSPAALPAGVKCAGGACTGKDPETMGCGGQRAKTAGATTVGGTYVEVRYSETCKAAWARMTQGGPGDTLRVSAASRTGEGRIERGTDGHSTMIAVAAPSEARACVVLSTGRQGCTVPRTGGADDAPGARKASETRGAAEKTETPEGAGKPEAGEAPEVSQEVP